MEPISKEKAIKILHNSNIVLFDIADAQKIFNTKKENTLYKLLQRLEKSKVIIRLNSGKYQFALQNINDFELANFLINPSYISLETALSFYGILPQLTYSITSITPLKTQRIICQNKEYEYCRLESKYFFGFEKKDKFLIASPEKALLDQLYFASKKLRNTHWEDLNLQQINKNLFKQWSRQYSFAPLQKLIKKVC